MRPRVSVYLAVSLDGHIARADGGLDWLAPMQVEGEDYGYAAFFSDIDTLVMGRATYDTALGFDPWPYSGKRVVVMTRRALASRHGEVARDGDIAQVLDDLARDGVRHVYLDGGDVVRQGLAADVVDALTLSVVPVVLGSGRRLFDDGLPGSQWTLEQAQSFATGLAQLRYRRQRGA